MELSNIKRGEVALSGERQPTERRGRKKIKSNRTRKKGSGRIRNRENTVESKGMH